MYNNLMHTINQQQDKKRKYKFIIRYDANIEIKGILITIRNF